MPEGGWSKMFEAPPATKHNVISLGAGVQSSAMALMAARGEIGPMPDFCIFSDTQAEPESVYKWLEFLESELPFPVYRVSKGNLTDDCLRLHEAGDNAVNYKPGEKYLRRLIPVFGKNQDGSVTGAIGRACTSEYKILEITKFVRKRCGIKRGQKNVTVTQWIGISLDEIQRMKMSTLSFSQNRYPLIENRIKRGDCLNWMKNNGYPEPPRSACVYCPFHSDEEWRRLRDREPDEFARAIAFDKELRGKTRTNSGLKMDVFLHRSCNPLDEIDFDSDEDKGQQVWDFQAECEGMCGV